MSVEIPSLNNLNYIFLIISFIYIDKVITIHFDLRNVFLLMIYNIYNY